VKKKYTDQAVIKPAGLETIHTLGRYSERDWLHIYKNDSLTDKNGNAGEGIHCKPFSFYLTLWKHATRVDGELEAINFALMQICSWLASFKEAVIFSDPTAAMQVISGLRSSTSLRSVVW
jgi:hypothetical protein